MEGEKKALVLGAGLSGRAAARLLEEKGFAIYFFDDKLEGRKAASGKAGGYVDLKGALSLIDRASVVVASPGFKPEHPLVKASGEKLTSEITLAAGFARGPVVAITGTNGKTTVTTLVSEVFKRAGFDAVACGNIGKAFSEAVVENEQRIFVVEASSFQLFYSPQLSLKVGAWLNISPNHLDWHGDFESYARSKAKILSFSEVAVINAEDPVIARFAQASEATCVGFGTGSGDFLIEKKRIFSKALSRPLYLESARRSSQVDLLNYAAAAAIASQLKVPAEVIEEVLCEFSGLEHRMELVASKGELNFYNDSKATCPGATIASVKGMREVVLIAGGRNKGTDLSALLELIPSLKAVVGIGECGKEIVELFLKKLPARYAADMEEAVRQAVLMAEGRANVVLSPAAASFDMFSSYEERGRAFKRAVLKVVGDGRSNP